MRTSRRPARRSVTTARVDTGQVVSLPHRAASAHTYRLGWHSGAVLGRLRLAVAVVALCALTSCTARSGVAVSGSDQTVKLHLARCDSEERVWRVKLATPGPNEIPDDVDDHVLWEVRA